MVRILQTKSKLEEKKSVLIVFRSVFRKHGGVRFKLPGIFPLELIYIHLRQQHVIPIINGLTKPTVDRFVLVDLQVIQGV